MKTLLMILTLSYCGIVFSQNSNDVKGWRGTEWGMSSDSVKNLFTNEITMLKKTNIYFNSFNPFMIKDYEISGHKFNVDFFFTGDTHKLDQIQIKSYWSRDVANSLEIILTEKYGIPSFKAESPYKCQWKFESTLIEIEQVEINDKLILIYKQPDKSSKSKI